MIGESIKKLRIEKDLTLEELANELNEKYPDTVNFNKGKLSKWENEKEEPKLSSLRILADYFNVSIDDMYNDFRIRGFVDKKGEIKHDELLSDSIKLPFYPSVAAGALAEMESVDVWNIDTISIPAMMLDSYAETKGLFAMRVNGDSMDNVIPHKSIIVVKPVEQSIYKDGDIVVFSYNQEYSLKRYRPNIIKDFVIFEPDSTDGDFKSIPINKKDLYESNEVSVYGKVIFFSTTL